MALLTSYKTGTITVAAGATVVTGAGTNWTGAGVREGDVLWAGGVDVAVLSVESATQLTLAFPWPGGALTGVAYELRYTPDASRVLASSREALASLSTQDSRVAAIELNVRPTHRQWGYGDTFTIKPTDDWQSIIEAYDGTGTITLANGEYVATRRLKPRGKPFLRAATLGGVRVVANWEFLQGTGARFWEIDMTAQDKADLWLRATMAYVDFRDVLIDAADPSFAPSQWASCAASDIRFTASLRDVLIDLGPNVAEGWDFDSGTNVKVAANTNDKRVKLLNRVPDGSSRQMWVFDQSRMICDGLHVINPNTGVRGGIGISARRGSVMTFQQSDAATDGPHNRITEQLRGLILRQNSTASFQGSYVALNNIGIQTQDGGFASYKAGGLTFSGNTTDVDDQNSKTDVQYLGRGGTQSVLTFTSGASTIGGGQTSYLGPAYAGTDQAIARVRVPRNGTLKNLSVRSSLAPGAGQTFTATLMKGSAPQALSAVIADTAATATDKASRVTLVEGDLICIQIVASAGAAARAFNASVELE